MSGTGRREAVDRFYSRWAGVYDLLASSAPGIRRVRRHAVSSLSLSAGNGVVEMGCGTGANFPALRERVGKAGTVAGIDLARGALGRARTRIDRHGWKNVHLVRGDVTALPVRRADAVLATFVVGMLDEPGNAVETWLDLLEPGGRVALLNATRSGRPAMAPLDLAFRGFVRLAAPGNRTATASPAETLEARVADAHGVLLDQCENVRRESLGGGYLTLVSARKPG